MTPTPALQVDSLVKYYRVHHKQPGLRGLLTVVIPIAFMTTFSAEALLGWLSGWMGLAAIALAGFMFFLSAYWWKFALRYYTGASA